LPRFTLQALAARKEKEEAVAKAQMEAALSGGASWGFGEDAFDEEDPDGEGEPGARGQGFWWLGGRVSGEERREMQFLSLVKDDSMRRMQMVRGAGVQQAPDDPLACTSIRPCLQPRTLTGGPMPPPRG